MSANQSFILPSGWIQTTLRDILILEYGKNLVGRERKKGEYFVWGSNGVVGKHDKYLIEGPVIIIGRKGSVGTVHYSLENCWPIDTTYFLKPVKSLNFFFIFYLLKSLNLEKLDKSTTIPGLNRNNIYDKSVYLPPLEEQERIVEKIEELFSELNAAEESLKKTKKMLETYRFLTLKNAFEGRLSKVWRNENDTKPRIKIREVSKTEKDKLAVIPKEWKWTKIKDVANITMGQSPKGSSYNNKGIGTPLINGPLEFGPSAFSYTLMTKWTTNPTKLCQKDDLILCVRGSTTGRQNIAGFTACIGRGVASVRANSNAEQGYLNHFFNYSRRKIFDMGTGTTFPNISQEQILNFYIPIPSKQEQVEIIEKIEYKLTIIDNSLTTINDNLKKIEFYRQRAIHKAFEGSLVQQKVSDKSSYQMLEMIKLENRDYTVKQKIKSKSVVKNNRNMEDKLSIIDVLKNEGKAMITIDVWKKSVFEKDIDGFYSKLKEHITNDEIKELPRKGKNSFITLNSTT